jgi:uncharacterized protein YjbI with pentapeptide repeats
MPDESQVQILSRGVSVWNQWRLDHPGVRPDLRDQSFRVDRALGIDLSGANFRSADLTGADFYRSWLVDTDFSGADLRNAIFGEATLGGAKFRGAVLRGANFMKAHLYDADFFDADLTGGALLIDAKLEKSDFRNARLVGAILRGADFKDADLTDADLSEADLQYVRFVDTNLDNTSIRSCRIYGISVWNIRGKPKPLPNLIIARPEEASITVDDLDVAQFVYLILNNEKIKSVIDTITSRTVLILGRFTPPERKAVLDAVRDALRARGYVPIVFDFAPSDRRDLTETIQMLANMARFVVADLTDAKSIPQELSHIVPNLPSVPVQPILLASQRDFAMFEHWRSYPWVLTEFLYEGQAHLIDRLEEGVIKPAESRLRRASPEDALKAATREIEALKRQLAEQRNVSR